MEKFETNSEIQKRIKNFTQNTWKLQQNIDKMRRGENVNEWGIWCETRIRKNDSGKNV